MTPKVGTLLDGRYELEERIGTGGMSAVYRALDTVLEREVAVKIMHGDIAAHSDQLERFRREARAVAQLSHQHIVTVIDAGDDERDDEIYPYIVFEYVQGETLKERIERCGRLEIPESVAYAIEIARALGAAHDHGIVHRDVKPQNVLVDATGSAKVTDFGIARTGDAHSLTASGRVLGTTDYVSPEQALGKRVGKQSDIYSLGIVLYEMLVGEVPFHAENDVGVAMKHVREDLPDVQLMRPEVSSALAVVVDNATAKDLKRRYPNTDAMIADLEEVLAFETARAGQITGEAAAVVRTLSPRTKRVIPAAVLHRTRAIVLVGSVILAIVLVLVLAGGRTERGTSQRPVSAATGLHPKSLAQDAASSFDPDSDNKTEHNSEARFVLDDDPGTSWSTETYTTGDLGKPGVGLVVDAKPGVIAKALSIRTPTQGFEATIYAANAPRPDTLDGWTKVSPSTTVGATDRIALSPKGQLYRYFMVWITKLPPGKTVAQISELVLYD